MTRIMIALVLGLSCALTACGGPDDAQESATKASEATQATVDSAPQAGALPGEAAREATQATVESAQPGEESPED